MQPGGHANDFGFTLGGPVYIPKLINGKNKLFWFFSYSGNRTRQPARSSEITNTVPTMAGAAGQLLGPAGNQCEIPDLRSAERGGRPGPARPLHPDAHSGEHHSPKQNRRSHSLQLVHQPAPGLPTTTRRIPSSEPFNNFLALGQADNVNYTGLASREDWAPNLKNRFSFSWNWSHFIENAQDWTYASSPGLQDWDNIRTARGGILNWTYSKSSAHRDYRQRLRQPMAERTGNYRSQTV